MTKVTSDHRPPGTLNLDQQPPRPSTPRCWRCHSKHLSLSFGAGTWASAGGMSSWGRSVRSPQRVSREEKLKGEGRGLCPASEVSVLWEVWKWEKEVGGGETEGKREVAAGM